MALASEEATRLVQLLSSLSDDEWQLPTECSPWTVRDMATHLLGYVRASCSIREQGRQVREAKKRGGSIADSMSALQVEELRELTPEQILDELRERAPAAVRSRRRVPALIRNGVRISSDLPVSGSKERWRMGYLIDTIATRDAWMHRMDISQAVERSPHLTADHDGQLVADVVGEWAGRHGRPVDLTLDGPAGGNFSYGSGGPHLTYDAVEFCRLLSGRGGRPIFNTEVPF
jgi:uncharacterized protein (TIGR03083 family)